MEFIEGTKMLADGLIAQYEPDVKKTEQLLSELETKQKDLLIEIEAENLKFSSVDINELNNMFSRIKDYHVRLMNIKKEMSLLTEKSVKLKKRAFQLQEYKQKEALENAHYREAQLQREQDLIALPGCSSSTKQNQSSKS